jgi:uncharacterized OB-fold protein
MSFSVPVCNACGRAVFPPRVLCPACNGREWTAQETGGVVEEVTERDGTRIASVRTDLGPVVIARLEADVPRGSSVALDADGGVPVVSRRRET